DRHLCPYVDRGVCPLRRGVCPLRRGEEAPDRGVPHDGARRLAPGHRTPGGVPRVAADPGGPPDPRAPPPAGSAGGAREEARGPLQPHGEPGPALEGTAGIVLREASGRAGRGSEALSHARRRLAIIYFSPQREGGTGNGPPFPTSSEEGA